MNPALSWFQRFLLPGFVFQSLCLAGGYGTGRELARFFLSLGPTGGLLGMLFMLSMLGHYPDIMQRPVPVNYMLEQLDSSFLLIAFPIVLIGTFIETGTGADRRRAAAVAPRHHRPDRRRLRRHDLGVHFHPRHTAADPGRLESLPSPVTSASRVIGWRSA